MRQLASRPRSTASRCAMQRRARSSAQASSSGIDFGAMLAHARDVGGPASAGDHLSRAGRLAQGARQAAVGVQGRVLRALVSHRRHQGGLLDRHRWRHRHGFRLRRAKPRASLPNGRVYLDGERRGPVEARQLRRPAHLSSRAKARRCTSTPSISRCGACSRSSRRRFSPACPSIVKPATATAYLTELVGAPHHRVGHPARGCAAARVRQRRAICSST